MAGVAEAGDRPPSGSRRAPALPRRERRQPAGRAGRERSPRCGEPLCWSELGAGQREERELTRTGLTPVEGLFQPVQEEEEEEGPTV